MVSGRSLVYGYFNSFHPICLMVGRMTMWGLLVVIHRVHLSTSFLIHSPRMEFGFGLGHLHI